MKFDIIKYQLKFRKPAGTSRGVLLEKPSEFLVLQDKNQIAIGECSRIPGLSIDFSEAYDKKLQELDKNAINNLTNLIDPKFPAINFGLETLANHFKNESNSTLEISNAFLQGETGIPINGLVWMSDARDMEAQIREKINSGFVCIKLKIGAIDFKEEFNLLKKIRKNFTANDIIIRVDANGAFDEKNALEKLKWLSDLELHSIEQPIGIGNWEQMASLCRESPLPIALDEELIFCKEKSLMLDTIMPQFIILKPSLMGGFGNCDIWIDEAEKRNIGWWATSALESNVGLDAIAQWVFEKNIDGFQGLGTGGLFTNNIESPLEVKKGHLFYNPSLKWNYGPILNLIS